MRILLVEDSASIRFAMNRFIGRAGHECISAEDGEKAVQIVENTAVDMIIMDVQMPGLDGFETTTLIREMLGDHWIPIIFVTGRADDESVERGIEAGGDDYLVKPVSEIILNAKIRAMERIITMRDEMAAMNTELLRLSQHDSMTGLLNRRAFTQKAQEHWRLASRNKEPFALIMLDIDHFKQYNDRYGHPEGDECIKQVARVLSHYVCRPGDLVARYGGEEFICLLPNTPEKGAKHVCESIRAGIEHLQIKHADSMVSAVVTSSLGCACVTYTTGTTLSRQIELADQALYQAKEAGRNRYMLAQPAADSHILVVDDCANTREIISDSLMGHCQIECAKDGESALDMVRAHTPDLIILDVHLPGISGHEVCKQLKAREDTARIPVILISSDDKKKLISASKAVQANAFIQKPINPDQLINKIARFLI